MTTPLDDAVEKLRAVTRRDAENWSALHELGLTSREKPMVRLLAKLLDPHQPHGLEGRFAASVWERVQAKCDCSVNSDNISYSVALEPMIHIAKKQTVRYPDIVVTAVNADNSSEVLARLVIEAKIDSGEGVEQTADYAAYYADGGVHTHFAYLAPVETRAQAEGWVSMTWGELGQMLVEFKESSAAQEAGKAFGSIVQSAAAAPADLLVWLLENVEAADAAWTSRYEAAAALVGIFENAQAKTSHEEKKPVLSVRNKIHRRLWTGTLQGADVDFGICWPESPLAQESEADTWPFLAVIERGLQTGGRRWRPVDERRGAQRELSEVAPSSGGSQVDGEYLWWLALPPRVKESYADYRARISHLFELLAVKLGWEKPKLSLPEGDEWPSKVQSVFDHFSSVRELCDGRAWAMEELRRKLSVDLPGRIRDEFKCEPRQVDQQVGVLLSDRSHCSIEVGPSSEFNQWPCIVYNVDHESNGRDGLRDRWTMTYMTEPRGRVCGWGEEKPASSMTYDEYLKALVGVLGTALKAAQPATS